MLYRPKMIPYEYFIYTNKLIVNVKMAACPCRCANDASLLCMSDARIDRRPNRNTLVMNVRNDL